MKNNPELIYYLNDVHLLQIGVNLEFIFQNILNSLWLFNFHTITLSELGIQQKWRKSFRILYHLKQEGKALIF